MGWRWLSAMAVAAAHDEQIAEHGGGTGMRDDGLLDSALARPRHLLGYGDPDAFDLAAAYAFGLVRNHPFVDGNKRTGFLAAYVFLDLNGWELAAPEADTAAAVLALAGGGMDEAAFAAWLREHAREKEGGGH
ncbi:type II toxin-antitoxin system death-on-curing family toxin [Desulfolutivibrio sulfoxidireducens]|uniref:type II toxin-antitoxin system death-on-curing family toxin n=1 Tax=Desulfolutivibrio sulfoxidireducens TaxID=2773299 RepID=UPI00159E81DE|nr:type II toxin-antitoxin system death-on-curing family toxin [Desulfolutivibrio sulfoxidireducens]QLA17439.1 type II toxin-antitoxin system death-on-curing family toxin [Desulfolutivibrio sulfoxidireducens]QLA21028.1 type II toxin-antitoxin system death-on-curing family toxin [Desulfolutivibrio sulfoxidireducens]